MRNKNKILIFGNGFLGSKIYRHFSDNGFDTTCADIVVNADYVQLIDARDGCDVDKLISREIPNVIINTIALSSYYACEKNPELCNDLNVIVNSNILNSINEKNIKHLYISSSYVFDGVKGNYTEEDRPNGKSVYAKSKILSEENTLKLENSAVIRLEPLYGYDHIKNEIKLGTNYLSKLIEKRNPMMMRAPILINDVPRALEIIINDDLRGVYHLCGNEKFEFNNFIEKLSSISGISYQPSDINSNDWIIHPPFDTTLCNDKIKKHNFYTSNLESSVNFLTEMGIKNESSN